MKPYKVTSHAVERVVERFGIPRTSAVNWINQLMDHATFVGNQACENGYKRIYYHFNKKARIVVGRDNAIITVIHSDSAVAISADYCGIVEETLAPTLPKAFADDIREIIQRKFNAKQREFKRKERTLDIELAELRLESAQLELNHARAKSPKVRGSLADKISELKTKIDRIEYEISVATESFTAIKTETEAFL